jgi:hypothetical protein
MHQRQTRLEAVAQRTHLVARQPRWRRRLGGPMTHTAAGLLAATVCLAGLLLAAPADEKPPPVPLPAQGTIDLTGYCGEDFGEDCGPVVTFSEATQSIIQETTSPDGTITQRIAGHATATVTNLCSGESVTYNTSGPATVVISPNGTVSVDAAGPNLLWTLPELSFSGVPTISYTTGRVTFTVAPSGRTTAYELAGGARQTDVCAELAAP